MCARGGIICRRTTKAINAFHDFIKYNEQWQKPTREKWLKIKKNKAQINIRKRSDESWMEITTHEQLITFDL